MKNTKLKQHGDKYYVKRRRGEWAVNCNTKSPVSYTFSQKEKAIDAAKYLARKDHAQLEIQNSDGEIEKQLSFS